MIKLLKSGFQTISKLFRKRKETSATELTVSAGTVARTVVFEPTNSAVVKRNHLGLRNSHLIGRPGVDYHINVGTNKDGSNYQQVNLDNMVIMPIEMFHEIRDLIPEEQRVLKDELLKGYRW